MVWQPSWAWLQDYYLVLVAGLGLVGYYVWTVYAARDGHEAKREVQYVPAPTPTPSGSLVRVPTSPALETALAHLREELDVHGRVWDAEYAAFQDELRDIERTYRDLVEVEATVRLLREGYERRLQQYRVTATAASVAHVTGNGRRAS